MVVWTTVADRDDMSAPLAGRRAVVTGASSGIGAAIAVAFAAAGADVAGLHLGDGENADAVVEQVEAHGRRALMVDGDAGDSVVIDALAEAARDELGGLDIWV